MEIFKLFGSIFIDSDEAEKSISKTDSKAKSFGETLSKGIKTAGKWAAGIAAGAVAAGAALGKAVDSAAEYADEIDKASKRSGIAVENLQRLKYAAEQNGVEFEKIEDTAKTMTEKLGEVSEGNAEAIKLFDRLGVAVYDANGVMRNSGDIYNDVLAKLADMGNTAEMTAIGTQLFGESVVDLKPLLEKGSQGINDLKEKADELGVVMSEKAVDAGVKYTNAISDIKSTLSGAANTIGMSLLPIFQKFADKIIEYIPTIQKLFIGLNEKFGATAETLLDALFKLVESLLPPVIDLLNALIPIITEIIEYALPGFVTLLEFAGELIKNTVVPAFEGLIAFLNGDWITGIGKAGEAYVGVFESAFAFIDKLFGTNLSKWYDEVTAFWRDAGAKLYETAHADELDGLDKYNKYGSLGNDIVKLSNEYIRQGVDAEESLNRAVNEIVDTDEKAYYYNKYFKSKLTVEHAQARQRKIAETGQGVYAEKTSGSIMADYYEQQGKAALNKVPALASGGLAYGATLALIGDNKDASVNPEVVAPLSELKSLAKNEEEMKLVGEIKTLLSEIKTVLGTRQPVVIEVKLNNGTKLASALVDDFNALIRNTGKDIFVKP